MHIVNVQFKKSVNPDYAGESQMKTVMSPK